MNFLKRFAPNLDQQLSSTRQSSLSLRTATQKRTWFTVLIAITGAFVFLSGGATVLAQAAQPAAASSQPAAAADTIDPDAIEAVNKMSAYLRTLKSFQVIADSTNDDVLENGQIVQYTSKVDLLASKPNRLRAELTSDDKHRLFLYDGKNFTVWGRLVNYYATVPAPPTIDKLIDQVNEKYDIQLPLIDLFRWGSHDDDVKKIKGAIDIGPSTVDGVTCEHYVFHQENVDWQIWIQLGEFPLPRKLVIRTLTDDARPQHTDVLTWNLAPSFNDDAFIFDPPPDAKRIVLAEETPDATEKGK
jgi:hypothetical protein